MDTRYEFVDELKKLPKSSMIDEMIKEAKAGEFHDYKNNKYVCGKMAAQSILSKLGHKDLAKRIVYGDFDETPDEEDNKKLDSYLKEM
jgi:hypothetical protein